MRLGVSRKPVRHGWRVLAFNIEQFVQLYDLRRVLETTAIDRLAEGPFQTLRRPSPSEFTCPIPAVQHEGSRAQFSHKETAHV